MTLRPITRRILIATGILLATPLFGILLAGSFVGGMVIAMEVTIHR